MLFPMSWLAAILKTPGHPLWATAWGFGPRLLLALKLLILARMLGPEGIAVVVALAVGLAILESLTDTGLSAAVIQRAKAPTKAQYQAATRWTLARGLLIALILLGLSPLFAHHLAIPVDIAALVALVPLLRGLGGVQVARWQRHCRFRRLCLFQNAVTLVDLGLAVAGAALAGPAGVLVGVVLFELIQAVTAQIVLGRTYGRACDWFLLRSSVAYGGWLWATNVLVVMVNQVDKALAGVLVGKAALGELQVMQRIGQLGIVDTLLPLTGWTFPSVAAALRRQDPGLPEFVRGLHAVMIRLAASAATCMIVLAPLVVPMLLGEQWRQATTLTVPIALGMALGAWIALLVSLLKASGHTAAITGATGIQAAVFLGVTLLVTPSYGLAGLAWSGTLGLLTASFFLASACSRAGLPKLCRMNDAGWAISCVSLAITAPAWPVILAPSALLLALISAILAVKQLRVRI